MFENNNDVSVTSNGIQSRVEINNNYSDDEDMLIDYEDSDNEKNSFSEIMDKINNDIDICSTSGDKNQHVLNLTPNPLKNKVSCSLDIPLEGNIGPMQLQKVQIFLKTMYRVFGKEIKLAIKLKYVRHQK